MVDGLFGVNGEHVQRHVVEESSISTDHVQILLHLMEGHHVLDQRIQAKVVILKDVQVRHVLYKVNLLFGNLLKIN